MRPGKAFRRLGVSSASFRNLGIHVWVNNLLQPSGYISEVLTSSDSAHNGQPSKGSKRPKETAVWEENRPRYAPLTNLQRCCSI